MKDTKKIIRLSLLTTIALTIFIIEANVPPLVPVPGIKLGLSNVVTLIVLFMYGYKEAIAVLFTRIILGSIFAGQVMMIIYSISGGMLCLIVMSIAKKVLGKKSIWFTSILGAIAHNCGQIIIAIIIMNTTYILYYLPMLLISAIVTGFFIGIIVQYIINNYKIIENIIAEN